MTTTSPAKATPVKLTEEWYQGFDEGVGRTYFFHKPTRRSTWTRPDFEKALGSPTSPAGATGVPEQPKPAGRPTPVAASSGVWLEVFSPEHGRNFYYNKLTRESVWVDPRGNSAPETARLADAVTKPPVSPAQPQPSQRAPGRIVLNQAPPPIIPDEGGNWLQQELESFARDLSRQNDHFTLHPNERYEPDIGIPSNATRFSSPTKSSNGLLGKASSLLFGQTSGTELATYGDEPPRELEVKRAIRGVQRNMEYLKAEQHAQKEATQTAKNIESEGGYYTLLNVPIDATDAQLKKAFHKAMIQWHPDKVTRQEDLPIFTEKCNLINDAYNCLSDPWGRFLYDWFGQKRYCMQSKVIQCFRNYLLTGCDVIKHPRQGKPRLRQLWISSDFEYLNTAYERWLEPTKEQAAKIKGTKIVDILDITRGISTDVLARTGVPRKHTRYFSVHTPERTLDFEAESPERAEFLVSRLTMMICDKQQNREWIKRYYALDVQKKAKAESLRGGFKPKPPNETKPPPKPQGETPPPPPV